MQLIQHRILNKQPLKEQKYDELLARKIILLKYDEFEQFEADDVRKKQKKKKNRKPKNKWIQYENLVIISYLIKKNGLLSVQTG